MELLDAIKTKRKIREFTGERNSTSETFGKSFYVKQTHKPDTLKKRGTNLEL